MTPSSEPTPVTPDLLRGWELPSAEGSKYSRGQVVVVGGAPRSPGAALLAGEAALRVGAGRLTLAVGASVAPHIAVALPECGVVPLAETADGHVRGAGIEDAATDLQQADAVLVGPGLDDAEQTAALLSVLPRLVGPETIVVLDAYALGVLSDLRDEAAKLAGRLILTPNSDEVKRLVDSRSDDILKVSTEAAAAYGAVVSCHNVIVDGSGSAWSAGTGTIGLGTSGSGDVLAGAIAGIAARGATPAQAAVWGTFLHSTAGDQLATKSGPLGFLARELLEELPSLLDRLRPQ